MAQDPPHPYAFSHKEEFLALPPEDKPPHIWECLQYLEWRRGVGDVPEEEIDRNVKIMRHIAQDVAKALARKLEADGTYKNRFDPRWPRFHPNSKDPLYLTGCHPPLLLCLPDTAVAWHKMGSHGDGEDNVREMADWTLTPAGMHGTPEEQRESLRKDAEEYEKTVEATRKAEKEVAQARETWLKAHDALKKATKPPG